MSEGKIFKASEQFQNEVRTLAQEGDMALSRIEDALHGPEDHPGGEPSRQAFVQLCLERLVERTRAVMVALDRLTEALGTSARFGMSSEGADLPAVVTGHDLAAHEQHAAGEAEIRSALARAFAASVERGGQTSRINFRRFAKLKEPCLVERTIEIHAPLPDEERPSLLRLEALRPLNEPGYEIAVYRQETVLVSSPFHDALEPDPKPHSVHIWVAYDTIHSDWPTAEKALEQVLGFLELRCE